MSELGEPDLAAAFETARLAWPTIGLDRDRFSARAIELQDARGNLRRWASDFFLACAAGYGNRVAIETIDEHFVAPLKPRIQRLVGGAADAADVLQMLRERLFAGSRRIRGYNATAPLKQWITLVAIRTAVDRHRREGRARHKLSEAGKLSSGGTLDPADSIFRSAHRAEFTMVLRKEIAALPIDDRALIRLHLVGGVSIEKIAAERGVHRVTVARWVWRIGEQLLVGLQRHFKEKYGMDARELESLVNGLRSQLSLDLPAVLDAQKYDGRDL